ncbi:N-acetyl-gamma-glutamyl-phosphate reductase [Pradoshia sp.]
MNVSVVGATGYSGMELIRLLANHPSFTVSGVYSSSTAGSRLDAENKQLHGLTQLVLKEYNADEIADTSDLVFLALPSGIAKDLVPELYEKNVKIIDLSGDLRLKEHGEYEQWYKKPAAKAEYVQEAVYGLSEWNRPNIGKAKLLANPGCYPTATLLALAPLAEQGLIESSDVIVDAKSGISGAGKKSSNATHYAHANENLSIYKVHKHQHIPEIEQQLRHWNSSFEPIMFSTHLVPMTRGIMATIHAKVKKGVTSKEILDAFVQKYEKEPFVRLRGENDFPSTKEVYGTNFCDIGFRIDERTDRVTLVSVIDNLVKGAAGQAVHNANIMMGLKETEGLQLVPVFP